MIKYQLHLLCLVLTIFLQFSVNALPGTRQLVIADPTEISEDGNIPAVLKVVPVSLPLVRRKRKIPEAHFGTQNAFVGLIFSKIDNIISAKTRFVDALDRSNIEKNRGYNITVPRPIGTIQEFITAAASPKIASLTNILGSLTTGVLGGIGSLSGGNGQSTDPGTGVGNIVTKFLSLSGPLLQSSGNNIGGGKPLPLPSADEAGY